MEDQKPKFFGEKIAELAQVLASRFSSVIDTERLASDRSYIMQLQEEVLKPFVVEKAVAYDDEDIINQIFFQITPDATPQLDASEFCAGVCIENMGNWKIREHNLTHIKDIVEDNVFFKWWYFECIRMGVPGWTRVYFDRYLNRNVVTHCTPVYSENKSLIGVLGIDLDYNCFTEKTNNRLLENIRSDIETVKKEREAIGVTNLMDHQYLDINTYEFINSSNITGALGFHSPVMREIMELVKKAIISNATVLLQGETGVGKDYIAKNIHMNSKFSGGPFINVNCCALAENLIESELFGYGKGSFTGAASEGKAGFFEAADGGTLLLNEIGDLPLHLQAKLLNVIHEKEVIRVGETRRRKTNFRLIAATNKDLAELVKKGQFREDLYYRINVLPITIPPLRERKEDIFPLIHLFLAQNAEKYQVRKNISVDLVNKLIQYPWPGNVRELENLIERLFLISDGDVIASSDLPEYFNKKPESFNRKTEEAPEEFGADAASSEKAEDFKTLKNKKEEMEADLIREKYRELKSSYKVAEALGISQSSAYKKIKKYL
ncbi:MAG TPA: sigma 54-interacting transcriptional regulator [Bacillota bacterium]|nr:sigma 54-interacting transcriptional regulator [Bacillota bacterium]